MIFSSTHHRKSWFVGTKKTLVAIENDHSDGYLSTTTMLWKNATIITITMTIIDYLHVYIYIIYIYDFPVQNGGFF